MHGLRPYGPALLLAALIGAAFAPHFLLFGDSDWEKVYIPAAERLRAGDTIYRGAFVYPPFAVLLPLPATATPEYLRYALFWAMNVCGGIGLLLVGWRFTGGTFVWFPSRRDCAISLLGLASGFGFVFDVLVNRQIDLILAGGIVAGCWCLTNRRAYTGAVLIGLAAAAKCTPLLFIPYLVWVGRPREAAVVLVVAIGANFLPDLLYPPCEGQPRLKHWIEVIFAPTLASDHRPGEWYSAIGFNHSLSGWATRTGTAELYLHDGDWDVRPRENPATPRALKLVVGASALLLMGIAVVATRPKREVTPLGVGMTLCLMVLFSPMSSKPHFCVLIIPAWALARTAFEHQRRWLAISVAVALLGLMANKDLLGGYVYDWILWHGVIPIETLVLFAGCAWASHCTGRRGS